MNSIYDSILPPKSVLIPIIRGWLLEDISSFDFGMSSVGTELMMEATLFCKQHTILRPQGEKYTGGECNDVIVTLAGAPFINYLFKDLLDCEIEWKVKEGDKINLGCETCRNSDRSQCKSTSLIMDKIALANVKGRAKNILQGERLALNILTRCSGIATLSHRVRKLADDCNYKGELAATRKTTPGFRLVEKYGAIVGGFSPHRHDVSHMCMLKDNHIDACDGDIAKAINTVKRFGGFSLMIEVEARNLNDALVAAENGAHIIMLDNFSPDLFKEAAKIVKEKYPHVIIEGSGGLTMESLPDYFCDECDVLSMSFTVQGHPCVDYSLKLSK